MAKTIVKFSKDSESGGTARGNAKNTGAPGPTPAPTAKIVPVAPDQISFVRRPTPQGYGMSGPQPSSVDPGKQMTSPMGEVLKAATDDGQHVLDALIGKGTARNSDRVRNQLRDIARKNVATHPGTSGASKGGTVPAIDATRAPVVRNPTK